MTPRLFGNVLSMEARKMMSYRADFWTNVVLGFSIQVIVVYYVWRAIFHESGEQMIGGYTFVGMIYYYVLVTLLGKLVRGSDFGAPGVSGEIYDGSLTRFLVYPVSYFPFKYAQHLGLLMPGLAQLTMFGVATWLMFPVPDEVNITIQSILMTITAIAFANLLHFMIYLPIEAVAFWQDNVWSLCVMMRFIMGFLGGAMVPLTLFPEWSQLPMAVLPFKYLFAFPVNVLIGHVGVMEWLQGLGVMAAWIGVLVIVNRLVWKAGDLQYTGVGM